MIFLFFEILFGFRKKSQRRINTPKVVFAHGSFLPGWTQRRKKTFLCPFFNAVYIVGLKKLKIFTKYGQLPYRYIEWKGLVVLVEKYLLTKYKELVQLEYFMRSLNVQKYYFVKIHNHFQMDHWVDIYTDVQVNDPPFLRKVSQIFAAITFLFACLSYLHFYSGKYSFLNEN